MACTLAWAVKFLASAPEVQIRLREDLINLLPHPQERSPTYEDLINSSTDLAYLEAVVHEILRCARTLGDLSRETTQSVILGGVMLPPKTTLIMPHGYWGDRQFRPDRWIDEDGRFKSDPSSFHAFGHGPRGCFGKHLAVSLSFSLFFSLST